jgi:hypothetical protein
MRKLHLSVRGFPYPTLFVSVSCVALTLFLSSCSADILLQRESQQAEEDVLDTHYSIVCVIHGDGDYLYHDTSGNEYKADQEALTGAKKIAQLNPHAEVFIFHQRPKRYFLFFFPLRDGEFYYYRNGQLIANELYWRDQEQSYLDSEVRLYRRFHTDTKTSVFLYCGHEIPEFGGMGYDASYPDRMFNVNDLAEGLKNFTNDSARIDLMILSTCYGGTPYTIGTLGSFTRTIIASPDNLHLSYFDLHPLERLDLSLQDGDVPAFAQRFARQSFDRLTRDIETAVSVAVYDVERIQKFLHSVQKVYNDRLISLEGETQTFLATLGHCDCADLPTYLMSNMSDGVNVFYRPASFGRLKYKKNHSGWECWKE